MTPSNILLCLLEHTSVMTDRLLRDSVQNRNAHILGPRFQIVQIMVSQHGILEPQRVSKLFLGVKEKFWGITIIAQGYLNYDIGGTRIRKIIAWGYAKILRVLRGYTVDKF